MPLPESLDRVAADLVFESEDHVAIVCLVQTADQRLKMISLLDFEAGEFAGDDPVIYLFRMCHQTNTSCLAIFHLGGIEEEHKAFIGTIIARTG